MTNIFDTTSFLVKNLSVNILLYIRIKISIDHDDADISHTCVWFKSVIIFFFFFNSLTLSAYGWCFVAALLTGNRSTKRAKASSSSRCRTVDTDDIWSDGRSGRAHDPREREFLIRRHDYVSFVSRMDICVRRRYGKWNFRLFIVFTN